MSEHLPPLTQFILPSGGARLRLGRMGRAGASTHWHMAGSAHSAPHDPACVRGVDALVGAFTWPQGLRNCSPGRRRPGGGLAARRAQRVSPRRAGRRPTSAFRSHGCGGGSVPQPPERLLVHSGAVRSAQSGRARDGVGQGPGSTQQRREHLSAPSCRPSLGAHGGSPSPSYMLAAACCLLLPSCSCFVMKLASYSVC